MDVFASGGGLFRPEIGLAFGPDGNLYVSGAASDNVVRYDGTTGAFIDVFASGGGLAIPHGIVFTPTQEVPEPASLTLFGLGALASASKSRPSRAEQIT